MKSNQIKWLPITLLIAALSTATQVNAQPFGKGGPRMDRPDTCLFGSGAGPGQREAAHGGMRDPGMRLLRMSALELSDAQESSILQLSQQFRKDIETHRATMESAWLALREVRQSDTFDEAALREAMDALHPVRVEGMVLRESYRHALHDVLSEVQQAKIDDLDTGSGRRAWGKGRMGRGPGSETRGQREGRWNEGRGPRT